MTVFANVNPPLGSDGIRYAAGVPLTSNEADLFSQTAPAMLLDPVPIGFNQAILAIVQFAAIGGINSNVSYVVMQTDLGDGVWIDVAWCRWTGTSGSATFVLSDGIAGANAFQQSRSGAPASNGSNQITLGGRIRFIGAAAITSSSSSSSSSGGAINQVVCTITYRLLGLR